MTLDTPDDAGQGSKGQHPEDAKNGNAYVESIIGDYDAAEMTDTRSVKIMTNSEREAVELKLSDKIKTKTGNVVNPDEWSKLWRKIMLTTFNRGTSRETDWSEDSFKVKIGGKDTVVRMNYVVEAIASIDGLTLRRAMRHFATAMMTMSKRHHIRSDMEIKAGLPSQHYYLAFDYADGIDPKNLSNDERKSIAVATAVAVTRRPNAEQDEVVNTSAHWTALTQRARAAAGNARLLTAG